MPEMNEGEQLVQEFHDRHAGRTFESFGRGTIGDGNSYDLVAKWVLELEPGSRVLDLACGDGVLLQIASELRDDLEFVGVDLNAAELEMARKRRIPGADFIQARAEALPSPDEHVDLVVCHMSFMLFDRPAAVAAELGRVLRPGGTVVLLVGDGSSPEGARRGFIDLVKEQGVQMPSLGTRQTRTKEGLAEIFETPMFRPDPTLESVELNLDGSPTEVWRGLSLMYNFEPLSPEQKTLVRRRFFERFGDAESARYRISMILGVFERAL